MAINKFSVIVPTYTGASTIADCFDSMLSQDIHSYELLIIIDGPNKELLDICSKYKSAFEGNGINTTIRQFKNNKGRFAARLEGARLAKSDKLLFVDDRITFEPSYFSVITSTGKRIVIPNVNEGKSQNPVSRCLYLLRRLIYGSKKFGSSFKSYYITKDNFEISPKGTTSLYIEKEVFINACEGVEKDESAANRYVNEDTKIFKELLNSKNKLYKSNEAVIYYHPREGAIEELKHMYHRGPRFVDYYIRPGTRFFPFLMLGICIILLIPILGILKPIFLLYAIAVSAIGLILLSISVATSLLDFFILVMYVPVIFVCFACGVTKGLLVTMRRALG